MDVGIQRLWVLVGDWTVYGSLRIQKVYIGVCREVWTWGAISIRYYRGKSRVDRR